MTNLTSTVHSARTRANWSNDLLLNTNYETFNYIFRVKEYIYIRDRFTIRPFIHRKDEIQILEENSSR